MRKKLPFGFYSFLFIFLLGIYSLGNIIERQQTLSLLLAYVSVITAYLFLMQEKNSFGFLLSIGILSRILMFVTMPSLSDDIYRFIWDGTLLSNGIHPFDQLPGFYLDQNIPGIDKELFNRLNSKTYFTVYPPIDQFIFWLSANVGNGDWIVSTNVIRSILLFADIGTFLFLVKLLKKHNQPVHLAFWFLLNPLVILEFCGNSHFEGLVLFFLVAGIYWMDENKKILSGCAFGLAIGTKLLPFIFLPYIFIRGIRNKKWSVAIVGGVVGLVSLTPMLSASFLEGMQSSLNLYFQKFEFNASLYFIAREIGFLLYGYNKIATIGPLLSFLSFISIIGISILAVKKNWDVPRTFLFILSIYFLFSTTVHPWYILPLIAFGILSGYFFPIVWSFLIFVTYLGYSEVGFDLPPGFIIFEYVILFIVIILELKGKKIIIAPQ